MIDLNFITQGITNGNIYLEQVFNGNEFAIGAVIAGVAGFSAYMIRELPVMVWFIIKKHLTTTLSVNNTQASYHLIMRYLLHQGLSNESRAIKLGNGLDGYNDNTIKEVGYGSQFFWFKNQPIIVNIRSEELGSAASIVKEFVTIRKLGRSHKLFDDLMKDMYNSKDQDKTRYYKWEYYDQTLISEQPKHDLNKVILSNINRINLMNVINTFITKEDWYLKHNIPYQLGILLYGPSGTGKNRTIQGLAAYLNKDIIFVEDVSNLISASQSVKNGIIVVDEVDTLDLRKSDYIKDNNSSSKSSLGKILSALDGGVVNHGRIIILTTNHRDVLDSAMLRPGRIDLQLELGNLDVDMFKEMLRNFFTEIPDFTSIIDKLSPAQLQNDIMMGKSLDSILKLYINDSKRVSDGIDAKTRDVNNKAYRRNFN